MEKEKSDGEENTSVEEDQKADNDDSVDENKSDGGEVNGDEVDVKEEDAEKLGFAGPCLMGKKKKEKKTLKRPKKEKDEAVPWDCNECTYQNKAEDFKCEMCFASKATSKGRKARRDPTIVQERVQQAMMEEEEMMSEPILPILRATFVPPIPEVKKEFTEGEMKERFQCDQCDGHFSAPGNLARHKLSKHEGVRFSCELCGTEFTAQGNLNKHKLTEHDGVRYACDQCGAEFTAQGNLKRHKMSKHEQVRWECDLCKSTFTDQGNLRRHKLTKHEGATYDCYQCPAQFGNHGTLRRHILTEHEGVRLPRYDCDLCEAQFSDVGNLKRHKITKHEGVKYNCDQCDEEFTEMGNLKRHKLTKHDGIRYDCDQCEARFYDQDTLKKHKLTKHEGVRLDRVDGGGNSERKPYSCQICGFKCGKKPNLKSHIKRRHCTDTLTLKELDEMYPDMYKYHDIPGQEGQEPKQEQAQHLKGFQGVGGLLPDNGVGAAALNHYIPAKQEPEPPAVQVWGQQHAQATHMVPQSVGGMVAQVPQVPHMGQMSQMGAQMGQMGTQSIPQVPQKKYLQPQKHQQHDMTSGHGAKFHHEPRYIPGEQERLMQEQQQRLAMAGLMEYCNQVSGVVPGFDQNERYLLEQRERERLAHEQREREQRERYSMEERTRLLAEQSRSLQLPFSLPAATGHHDPRQALDHRLPQVAPLDMRDRMFQGQHVSNPLTEMYQRIGMGRTFNQ